MERVKVIYFEWMCRYLWLKMYDNTDILKKTVLLNTRYNIVS